MSSKIEIQKMFRISKQNISQKYITNLTKVHLFTTFVELIFAKFKA
jgi:hypothetical protein